MRQAVGAAYSLGATSGYSLLQYNPPYTLPWLRRNEIAIALEPGAPDAPRDGFERTSTDSEPTAAADTDAAAVADAAADANAAADMAASDVAASGVAATPSASSEGAREESAPSDVDGDELVVGEAAAEGGGEEGGDIAEPSEEDWMDAPSD